jgi:hypothetical protein
MRTDFKFRTGKHKGKTYREVEASNPGYIDWVLTERPEMLRERESTRKANEVIPSYLQEQEEPPVKFKPLEPNYNFENEINMSDKETTEGELNVRLKMTKMKVGLFAQLSKETNTNGRVKYDKNWLLNVIFDSEHDNDIKSKLQTRINGSTTNS